MYPSHVLRFVFTTRSGSTPVVKGNGASGVFAVDNRKIDRADHKSSQVLSSFHHHSLFVHMDPNTSYTPPNMFPASPGYHSSMNTGPPLPKNPGRYYRPHLSSSS